MSPIEKKKELEIEVKINKMVVDWINRGLISDISIPKAYIIGIQIKKLVLGAIDETGNKKSSKDIYA